MNENDNDNIESHTEEKLKNPTITTSINGQGAIPKTRKQKKENKKENNYKTEFANQYKKLDKSKKEAFVIDKFYKGLLDKKTILNLIIEELVIGDDLTYLIIIIVHMTSLKSIQDLLDELNNEKDTETKNESLWKATLDGKIGSLDNKLFIKQYDEGSITSEQLKLLIKNNLLNQRNFPSD